MLIQTTYWLQKRTAQKLTGLLGLVGLLMFEGLVNPRMEYLQIHQNDQTVPGGISCRIQLVPPSPFHIVSSVSLFFLAE